MHLETGDIAPRKMGSGSSFSEAGNRHIAANAASFFDINMKIDFDSLAFDDSGRQVGMVIPEDLLGEICGGLMAANGECGTDCKGSNNSTCGNRCAVATHTS